MHGHDRAAYCSLNLSELYQICCSGCGGMSLEDQKASLAAARAKAQKALAKDDNDAGLLEVTCPCSRQPALGCDRDGKRYWHLSAATAFAGQLAKSNWNCSKGYGSMAQQPC